MPEAQSCIAPWLLRSKVTPPRQLLKVVERPDLVARLDAGVRGSLILIEAPGGYGKSCLLAEWSNKRQAAGDCACWLSIDEDEDPDTLIAYLAFSAHMAGVDVADAGLLAFQVSTEKNAVQSIYKLLSCLERHPAPVHIILDDCERLGEATREAVLPLLLRRLPENCTLVLASREAIAVNTVDIEHRGLVTRMGPKALRFSHDEMRELWKGRLTERQVRRLETQTEGWPVLVRLLLSAADIGEFDIRHIEEVSHSDSSITSYFEQKILSRIGKKLREFLITASIFEDITEDVLSDLLGVGVKDPLRAKLETLEAFIAPLAGEPGGFRVHPMMREYLSHQFMAEDPARFAKLHERAARWYSRQANHIRAVRHAIANGDRGLLLEIIEATGGLQLWLREGLVEFRVIDRMLDDKVVLASPVAAIMRAIILMKSGKQAEAAEIYRIIMRRHGASFKNDERLSLSAFACRIMLSIYRGLYIPTDDIEQFEQRLSRSKENTAAFAGYLLTMKCVSAHQAGRLEDSIAHGKEAIHVFRAEGSSYGEFYIHLHLAMVGGLMNDRLAKQSGFDHSHEIIRRELSYDSNVKPVHQILSMECEHEASPFEVVHLQRLNAVVLNLLKGEGWIDIYAAACRTLSEKLYVAAGFEEAFGALQTFSEFAMRNDMIYLADIVRAQKALFLAIENRTDEAAEELARITSLSTDPEKYVFEAPWRAGEVAAEASLASGGPIGDVDMWRRFRDRRLEQGNRRLGARLSAMMAVMTGDENDVAALDRIICPELTRSIAFCADKLENIHGALIADKFPNIADVAAAVKLRTSNGCATAARQSSQSILSDREITVLRELAQGKSDKQIALALDLSEHGVRYHLKNIYVKLGAENRTDAVIKSQERGVLPALYG